MILPARDAGKSEGTRTRITSSAAVQPEVSLLDMADLSSLRSFAAR